MRVRNLAVTATVAALAATGLTLPLAGSASAASTLKDAPCGCFAAPRPA